MYQISFQNNEGHSYVQTMGNLFLFLLSCQNNGRQISTVNQHIKLFLKHVLFEKGIKHEDLASRRNKLRCMYLARCWRIWHWMRVLAKPAAECLNFYNKFYKQQATCRISAENALRQTAVSSSLPKFGRSCLSLYCLGTGSTSISIRKYSERNWRTWN